MSTGSILQYATLLSLLFGGISVAVAVVIHRDQVKTEIFLALSARYDELLRGASTDFWVGISPDPVLPERSGNLSIMALRFCTLVSLGYYLFLEHRISKRMWLLLLNSAERRIRSPLFVREWEHLRSEFESFPEFVALVASVQERETRRGRKRLSA